MHVEIEAATSKTYIYESKVNFKGEPVIVQYLKGKQLGKGGFAVCFHVTRVYDNKYLAIKIIPKHKETNKNQSIKKVKVQITIMKKLMHPNIVRLEHFFHDSDNCYILMELCDGGTLQEIVKRRKKLTEPEVRFFLAQLVGVLDYLRSQRVLHRDIKLANLFLDAQMNIRLGDFGLATILDDSSGQKKTTCGTPNYIAPEILQKKEYSYPVDVWSTGVVLFILLVGAPPFETKHINTTYQRIKKAEYQLPSDISKEAQDLIKHLLDLDPINRFQTKDIMAHEFMSAYDIPCTLPAKCRNSKPDSEWIAKFQIKRDNSQISLLELTESERAKSLIRNPFQSHQSVGSQEAQKELSHSKSIKDDKIDDEASNSSLKRSEKEKLIKSSQKFTVNNKQDPTFTGNKEQTFRSKSVSKATGLKGNFEADRIASTQGLPLQLAQKHRDIVRVLVWINVQDRYGLIYLLSNLSLGGLFNDGSVMVISPPNLEPPKVHYIYKNKMNIHIRATHLVSQLSNLSVQQQRYNILQYYKKKLIKSVKLKDTFLLTPTKNMDKSNTCLISHPESPKLVQSPKAVLSSNLTEHPKPFGSPHQTEFSKIVQSNTKAININQTEQWVPIHIKNWLSEPGKGQLFRLSNKYIQACFLGGNQIVIIRDQKIIRHTAPDGNTLAYKIPLEKYHPDAPKQLKGLLQNMNYLTKKMFKETVSNAISNSMKFQTIKADKLREQR